MIGAGVIGLSIATLLQSQYPDTPITIVAAELPGGTSPSVDYASAWAGAHYRPIPRSTRQLDDEANLAFHTAEVMKKIAKDSPEAGVEIVSGVEYLEKPGEDVSNLKAGDVYAWQGDQFRILDKAGLPPGVTWGCEYQTYVVNVHVYCQWLLSRLESKGGKVIQHRLSNAAEAYTLAQRQGLGDAKVVVNCSGRNFDLDPLVTVIRGQTVLVKQQYHRTITRQNRDGTWTFLIPRPRSGGTIVGGTKEVGDLEDKARSDTRRKLLQSCVEAFPDFVDSVEKFEVLKDNVGRRPWREGGVRIEAEQVSPRRTIVHGYGLGGRGYELSWGVADRVIDLVKRTSTVRARL